MHRAGLTRRRLLRVTGGAAVGALTGALETGAPFIRTARAAGRLSLALRQHPVPGADLALRAACEAWGQAERVEVQTEFIPSTDYRDRLLAASEARVREGHDIIALPDWLASRHRDVLEPLDDVVQAVTGPADRLMPGADYLFRHDGVWRAVPAPMGGHLSYPMVSRVDYFQRHAGMNLKRIFPASAHRTGAQAEAWSYDALLLHAEALHRAGHSIAGPIGPTPDAQHWLCPLFLAFGATAMDRDGHITIDSDATRAALEYLQRLTAFMPADIYGWDGGANDAWIGSGQGGAIFNPPDAWTAVRRKRPEVAAQLWHHDAPRGPAGRFRGTLARGVGVWAFSPNAAAAKALLTHLLGRDVQAQLLATARGLDAPVLQSLRELPLWRELGPPAGGLYNYPPRGDEVPIFPGYPAPPAIGAMIHTYALIPNLVARVTRGNQPVRHAIRWAERELASYLRG